MADRRHPEVSIDQEENFSLSWQVVKVNKKIGMERLYSEDGTPQKNASGSPKYQAKYHKGYAFEVPVGHAYAPGTDNVVELMESLSEQIHNGQQLAAFVRQLVKSGKDGYAGEQSIIDHMLWGLIQHPLQMLRQGQDARLTEAQKNALQAIVNGFKLGMIVGMTDLAGNVLVHNDEEAFEFCVRQAERQGIPDARRELQVRLFPQDEEVTTVHNDLLP